MGNTIGIGELLSTEASKTVCDGHAGIILVADVLNEPVIFRGIIWSFIRCDESSILASRVARPDVYGSYVRNVITNSAIWRGTDRSQRQRAGHKY